MTSRQWLKFLLSGLCMVITSTGMLFDDASHQTEGHAVLHIHTPDQEAHGVQFGGISFGSVGHGLGISAGLEPNEK